MLVFPGRFHDSLTCTGYMRVSHGQDILESLLARISESLSWPEYLRVSLRQDLCDFLLAGYMKVSPGKDL